MVEITILPRRDREFRRRGICMPRITSRFNLADRIQRRRDLKQRAILNGESAMTDAEDMKLKDEIDEIMKHVENIMKKVELILPAKQEDSQSHGE